MLRRLGPALEYADVLQATFNGCIAALKDDVGTNDYWYLRMLSRVLMCVDGLERDAQIAYTAQQYIRKDEEAHRVRGGPGGLTMGTWDVGGNAENAEAGTDEQRLKEAAGIELPSPGLHGADSEDGKQPMTPLLEVEDKEKRDTKAAGPAAPKTPEDETPEDEMREGLLPDALKGRTPYCNSCGKAVCIWINGPSYYCVYCIDMDLCESCMQEKLARERGEAEPGWRALCPKGHRHVKGPIEGWRGVKAGKFRIGEKEIPVAAWVSDLEAGWAAYWHSFWSEKET